MHYVYKNIFAIKTVLMTMCQKVTRI